jgi:hypothetical protein
VACVASVVDDPADDHECDDDPDHPSPHRGYSGR